MMSVKYRRFFFQQPCTIICILQTRTLWHLPSNVQPFDFSFLYSTQCSGICLLWLTASLPSSVAGNQGGYFVPKWCQSLFSHSPQLKLIFRAVTTVFFFFSVALILNNPLSCGFLSSQRSGGRTKRRATDEDSPHIEKDLDSVVGDLAAQMWSILCFSPVFCQSRTWEGRAACSTSCVCSHLCSNRQHWCCEVRRFEAIRGSTGRRRQWLQSKTFTYQMFDAD